MNNEQGTIPLLRPVRMDKAIHPGGGWHKVPGEFNSSLFKAVLFFIFSFSFFISKAQPPNAAKLLPGLYCKTKACVDSVAQGAGYTHAFHNMGSIISDLYYYSPLNDSASVTGNLVVFYIYYGATIIFNTDYDAVSNLFYDDLMALGFEIEAPTSPDKVGTLTYKSAKYPGVAFDYVNSKLTDDSPRHHYYFYKK